MKTAMQEFIDNVIPMHIIKLYDIKQAIKNALEKEKEQIIQARIDGDENYSLVGGKRYEYAEQYYNETYNQNK